MILVFATQILASMSLMLEVSKKGLRWYKIAPDAQTQILRFTCGFVLHIYLSSEILQGFNNIKFSINHPWKFERKLLAFFTGFLQVIVILVIELTNFVLVMTSNSYREIIINFIVLLLISQFDDFFYQTFANTEIKKFLKQESEPYSSFLKK